MKYLRLVVNGRLVRKLCMACKVGYTADPETLRRLNMSPEKTAKLFQAHAADGRSEGQSDALRFATTCATRAAPASTKSSRSTTRFARCCSPADRSTSSSNCSASSAGATCRKWRSASVESGDTSVQEVLRVLKATDTSGGTPARRQSGK